MNLPMFRAGEPACPVACKYCFITEHDARREVWNKNPFIGVNKASTFINVTPWIDESPEEQERFRSFPWHLLRGETVGFTAITDPFWPKLDRWFWEFIDQVSPHARLITAVTKWPLKREMVKHLASIKNFRLVVGITGNAPPIEKVSVQKHLETLRFAQEEGLKALPISHPYISGVSDLSFLPELFALGYRKFDVKGLRFDPRFAQWMPASSVAVYAGHEDEEILPEDGWREKVIDAGFELCSPRQWYAQERRGLGPVQTFSEAESAVDGLLRLANVVSSDAPAVRRSAVERRIL